MKPKQKQKRLKPTGEKSAAQAYKQTQAQEISIDSSTKPLRRDAGLFDQGRIDTYTCAAIRECVSYEQWQARKHRKYGQVSMWDQNVRLRLTMRARSALLRGWAACVQGRLIAR
jgi:hypothetical protein